MKVIAWVWSSLRSWGFKDDSLVQEWAPVSFQETYIYIFNFRQTELLFLSSCVGWGHLHTSSVLSDAWRKYSGILWIWPETLSYFEKCFIFSDVLLVSVSPEQSCGLEQWLGIPVSWEAAQGAGRGGPVWIALIWASAPSLGKGSGTMEILTLFFQVWLTELQEFSHL